MKSSQNPFMVVKTVQCKGVPWLEGITNVPDKENLKFGISYEKTFPNDASFSMDDDFKRDKGLADAFKNVSSLLVVSERLMQAIEAIPGALFENEVLPVQIINHKKQIETAKYFVIHQIKHPACLDEAKSKGTRLAVRPKLFQFMQEMVLDTNKIPEGKMLFRVEQFPWNILIRRELAEKLKAGNFTGIEFHEIKGFDFLLA